MECRMLLRVLALTLAVGLVAGCGESEGPKVKTVPVSGTVYLDGTPLDGVSVNFQKSTDYFGADATDSSGKYELQAEPGENNVFFSKTEGLTEEEEMDAGMDEDADADADEGDEPEPQKGQVIPAKYQDRNNPAETFNVPEEGATDADFKLTTDGGGATE